MEPEEMIAWCDLETTGLGPVVDHDILEICVMISDGDMKMVNHGPIFQIHYEGELPAGPVRDMHDKSGLLKECAQSDVSIHGAETACLRWFESFAEAGIVPLAGSTIGFDRKFLEHYMPDLHEWFHYRSIDVSSFNEAMKRWLPQVVARRPDKRELHRAEPDLEDSINMLRFYRNAIMSNRAQGDDEF